MPVMLSLTKMPDNIPGCVVKTRPSICIRINRSTEDAISTVLHIVFTHLENNNSYIRMLFVDFSSAFNIISPMKLIGKCSQADPRQFWWQSHLLYISLNRRAPQGCVLRPLVFTLYSHDCTPRRQENSTGIWGRHHHHQLHYEQWWEFISWGNP